jgi:hypothetical protein
MHFDRGQNAVKMRGYFGLEAHCGSLEVAIAVATRGHLGNIGYAESR